MEYLPISKATEIYKTSKTALTRLANKNIENKHIKKENGMFLISVELLESRYKKRVSSPMKESKPSSEHVRTINRTHPNTSEPNTKNLESEQIGSELITILKSENEFLKNEIGNKQKTIDTLLERQFEQNTIIQTLQSRIDGIGNKIDNSVLLLSEKMKENKTVGPGGNESDNGFTIASAVMILLLVLAIIVFLTVK